ncbi:MAG: SET domain-containing protein [bacterium]
MDNNLHLYDFIKVKNSQIQGNGLFSSINIKKDSKILVIEGDVIDETECLRREKEEFNVYIFWNDNNYIDTAKSEKLKYLNHSCSPNCYVADRDENSLFLAAIRDINFDEELTIDYGFEEIYNLCKCKNCSA